MADTLTATSKTYQSKALELPPEILTRIGHFIDRTSISDACLVCKDWLTCLRAELWRTIPQNQHFSSTFLEQFPLHYDQIRHLAIRVPCGDEAAAGLLDVPLEPTTESDKGKTSNRDMSSQANAGRDKAEKKTFKDCHRLESVDVTYGQELVDSWEQRTFATWSALSLFVTTVTNAVHYILDKNKTALRHLRIAGVVAESDQQMMGLLREMPSLRVLEVEEWVGVDGDDLCQLLRECAPGLLKLSLEMNELMYPLPEMKAWRAEWDAHQMNGLNSGGDNNKNDASAAREPTLSKIRTLILNRSNIRLQTLVDLASVMPELRELSLRSTYGLAVGEEEDDEDEVEDFDFESEIQNGIGNFLLQTVMQGSGSNPTAAADNDDDDEYEEEEEEEEEEEDADFDISREMRNGINNFLFRTVMQAGSNLTTAADNDDDDEYEEEEEQEEDEEEDADFDISREIRNGINDLLFRTVMQGTGSNPAAGATISAIDEEDEDDAVMHSSSVTSSMDSLPALEPAQGDRLAQAVHGNGNTFTSTTTSSAADADEVMDSGSTTSDDNPVPSLEPANLAFAFPAPTSVQSPSLGGTNTCSSDTRTNNKNDTSINLKQTVLQPTVAAAAESSGAGLVPSRPVANNNSRTAYEDLLDANSYEDDDDGWTDDDDTGRFGNSRDGVNPVSVPLRETNRRSDGSGWESDPASEQLDFRGMNSLMNAVSSFSGTKYSDEEDDYVDLHFYARMRQLHRYCPRIESFDFSAGRAEGLDESFLRFVCESWGLQGYSNEGLPSGMKGNSSVQAAAAAARKTSGRMPGLKSLIAEDLCAVSHGFFDVVLRNCGHSLTRLSLSLDSVLRSVDRAETYRNEVKGKQYWSSLLALLRTCSTLEEVNVGAYPINARELALETRPWSCSGRLRSLDLCIEFDPTLKGKGTQAQADEKDREIQIKACRQLGHLTCLEKLTLGGGRLMAHSQWSTKWVSHKPKTTDAQPGKSARRHLTLSMTSGLQELASLQRLEDLDLTNLGPHSFQQDPEIVWLGSHWPALRRLHGFFDIGVLTTEAASIRKQLGQPAHQMSEATEAKRELKKKHKALQTRGIKLPQSLDLPTNEALLKLRTLRGGRLFVDEGLEDKILASEGLESIAVLHKQESQLMHRPDSKPMTKAEEESRKFDLMVVYADREIPRATWDFEVGGRENREFMSDVMRPRHGRSPSPLGTWY
ncbi:hypothetical protein EDD11_005582 [Mortierella claussenii]|nr:hypothetical protein EDD11_005582 [Mortierella claussenii]